MKAAIFDMDGTILDSMSVWERLGSNYLISVGITPPDDIEERLRSLSFREAAELFIREFSLPLTPEELMRDWNKLLAERYRTMARLKPGAKEYLNLLSARGTKLCLATATNRALVCELLEKHGVFSCFRFIITEDDVGRSKSEPDIYLAAARRLGESPADCVVFEDSLHAIRTAKNAGFPVWGVYDPSSADRLGDIRALCDRMVDFNEELARLKNLP